MRNKNSRFVDETGIKNVGVEGGGEMKKVDIPFNDWSKKKHRAGKKNATTRTEKYGETGDVFKVLLDEGTGKTVIRYYRIWDVFRVRLRVVKNCFFRVEGCDSKEEFEEVWEDIHYKKGYEPGWKVYLHLYKEISEEEFEGGILNE